MNASVIEENPDDEEDPLELEESPVNCPRTCGGDSGDDVVIACIEGDKEDVDGSMEGGWESPGHISPIDNNDDMCEISMQTN